MSSSSPLLAKLGGVAFRGAQWAFLRKDPLAAERLGEKLGRFGYRLDRKHRERTIANLRLAFPERSDAEIADLTLATFVHFGRVAADFMRSPARTDQEVLDSIEPLSIEPFLQAESRGKGVIVITAHLGNWERFAHWSKALGREITVVARDADDTGVQAKVAQIRGTAGLKVLSRGNSARAILESLKRKELIGILPDQNAGDAFVPFFGKPCGTVLGPAVIHLRTGAPLLPAYCLRIGPGRYRVELLEPFEYRRGETEPQQVMADLNLALEGVIRRYPDQYLWLHDRWKSARKAGLL